MNIYYSPLFPRILEVNMSHILRPTGQKLGMAHILLPLGYHSVQSKLISCTLVQIHDIALHIHNNNIIYDLCHGQAPRVSELEYSVREKTTDLFCDEAESFGMEVRCWN